MERFHASACKVSKHNVYGRFPQAIQKQYVRETQRSKGNALAI